jgi:hypothetical protein
MANKSKLEALELLEKAPSGFDYLKPGEYKNLEKQGLVEVNLGMADESGAHACRLTDAGKEYMKSLNGTEGATASTERKHAMAQSFTILSAPLPQTKRKGGAGRPSKYPFDALEVGQFFFVPASADQPEPAKTLGSVVTSANRRNAIVVPGEFKKNRKGEDIPKLAYTKKFVIRPYTHEGVAGAGVWREQ